MRIGRGDQSKSGLRMTFHICITTTVGIDNLAEEMATAWKLARVGQLIAKEAEEEIERTDVSYSPDAPLWRLLRNGEDIEAAADQWAVNIEERALGSGFDVTEILDRARARQKLN